jgi:hypothetical protein
VFICTEKHIIKFWESIFGRIVNIWFFSERNGLII